MKNKETIAWECARCGFRHLWQWPLHDADEGDILMRCDACSATTNTTLVQIAAHVWAALWPGAKSKRGHNEVIAAIAHMKRMESALKALQSQARIRGAGNLDNKAPT